MTDHAAVLDGVTKRFGAITALDGMSFSIGRGELVALLGPNGAGKTTAVRLLLGLAKPDRGTARVFGADPRRAPARRRIGAMLQVARVPDTLRVGEHIELFASYYPSPMPIAQAVGLAGLRGLEQRLFGELSGGQKQRLLFALAICGNPDLLILDEPTVGLDIESRRAIWEQIAGFVRRGGSIVLTTHYLEEADALADRITVIDRGRVVAEGTPAEIKGRVSSKRIRCRTALSAAALRALAGVTSVREEDGVTEILTADSDAVLRDLFARDGGASVIEISGAGLEEAFLTLTAKPVREVA
jgi:ABC-2 type transport system ATP-binding protein